jgi:hypothetical protein
MTSNATTLSADTVEQWRVWLAQHGQTETEVWLVIPHRHSGKPGPSYEQAVEQALCFGWIDGLHRRRDAISSQLRFTPRRSRSTWSALNRARASRMIGLPPRFRTRARIGFRSGMEDGNGRTACEVFVRVQRGSSENGGRLFAVDR